MPFLAQSPRSGFVLSLEKMLTIGIRQKDAGDEIRIERVNPVTECAEDVLKRSAANNQFERSLVDGRQ
jgi:hypothetical protein